jgi:predicted short-subunit dehydrogenase-like oxidoreductase (DUF2520 family)
MKCKKSFPGQKIVERIMLSQKRKAPVLAVVGPGRVGCALGSRLHERGWRIGPVVGRSLAGARSATRAIGAGSPYARPARAVLTADLVLLTVPDGAIAGTAEELARIGGSAWRGKVVLHTSGALDRSALGPLERCGASTGSLHPLQTFGGRGVPPLEHHVCVIEGTRAALHAARRICSDLRCQPVVVHRGAKPAYHAAAVLAAGHVLGVVEAAVRILMAVGFSRRQAVRALLPLTRQTLENYERLGPEQAWTGPVPRGDLGTVAQHVAALGRFPREYRAAYAALTRLSLRVLSRRPGAAARRMERALAGS